MPGRFCEAARAPSLTEAMRTIREKAFVILDGTLLPIDRIAADTPYYSGKHKRHGMNVQVLTDPFGRLLWASPALPGSTHELMTIPARVVDRRAGLPSQRIASSEKSRDRS